MSTLDDYRPEFAHIAKCLAKLGATDEDIGAAFQIEPATLRAWLNRYPEFRQALHDGQAAADARVIAALHQRASGFTHRHLQVVHNADGTTARARVSERFPACPEARDWLRRWNAQTLVCR